MEDEAVLAKVYALLAANTTLRTALGGSSTDTKIYPAVPDKFENFPCVVYEQYDGMHNTVPKNTGGIGLFIQVISSTSKAQVMSILNLVRQTLNFNDTSADVIIFCKQVTSFDINFDDRLLYSKGARFTIVARKV